MLFTSSFCNVGIHAFTDENTLGTNGLKKWFPIKVQYLQGICLHLNGSSKRK